MGRCWCVLLMCATSVLPLSTRTCAGAQEDERAAWYDEHAPLIDWAWRNGSRMLSVQLMPSVGKPKAEARYRQGPSSNVRSEFLE